MATSAITAAAPTSSSKSFRIVSRTMQSLVLLIVSIGTVITVAWLVLNPRPPAFRLDSLSLSGLPTASDASSRPPGPHVRIQLTATNPNKKLGVVIQDVNLWLAIVHCKCQLPLLSPNHTASSEYPINKRSQEVLIFEGKTALRPCRGMRKKRPFQFPVGEAVMSVKMKVSVKFMHAYWPSKRMSVKVGCENLSLELSSSTRTGKLKDRGKDCLVRFA
ncbi:uncharacterized protein LOC104423440 [Eucalyptus grandis]|uniref:uncharacterized protein LOC104423440 n=1 Tax=Eucalyptus grandis TaxID=71139 RepID=UPI00192F004F|nr:uncharacterized protein LOC104423440 [Eucalyptus grandis]